MISDILITTFFSLLLLLTIYALLRTFNVSTSSLFSKYGEVFIETKRRKQHQPLVTSNNSTSSSPSTEKVNTVTNNSTTTTRGKKVSEILDQSKNLAEFFQQVSGVSVLEQCKLGSCQYAGVVSAIEAMKILKENSVDPLEFLGIQSDLLNTHLQRESDALNIMTIQLAAMTTNEGSIELNGNLSLSRTASFSSLSSVESMENLSLLSTYTSAPSSSTKTGGVELVSEDNSLKYAHLETVDDVFKTMRESSFDMWTVSRLAFQSAFNRELIAFISPNKAHVPSHWLNKELFTDSASSFRTGIECFILEQMGFIKNLDESLQDFQT